MPKAKLTPSMTNAEGSKSRLMTSVSRITISTTWRLALHRRTSTCRDRCRSWTLPTPHSPRLRDNCNTPLMTPRADWMKNPEYVFVTSNQKYIIDCWVENNFTAFPCILHGWLIQVRCFRALIYLAVEARHELPTYDLPLFNLYLSFVPSISAT